MLRMYEAWQLPFVVRNKFQLGTDLVKRGFWVQGLVYLFEIRRIRQLYHYYACI